MEKSILNFHFDYWNPSLICAKIVWNTIQVEFHIPEGLKGVYLFVTSNNFENKSGLPMASAFFQTMVPGPLRVLVVQTLIWEAVALCCRASAITNRASCTDFLYDDSRQLECPGQQIVVVVVVETTLHSSTKVLQVLSPGGAAQKLTSFFVAFLSMPRTVKNSLIFGSIIY